MEETNISPEEQVVQLKAELQERNRSLVSLAALAYCWAEARILGDPLDEFFAAPEFWEKVVPVDPSRPCRQACAKRYWDAVAACQNLPEGERLDCVNQAWDNNMRCTDSCRD